MTDLNAELDILERALAKAVDQCLSKNIDDVYDDLDNTTKDQERRMAHVQEELNELRDVIAELYEACEEHEERADGMAQDLWDTIGWSKQRYVKFHRVC